jgi:uncharacterized protein
MARPGLLWFPFLLTAGAAGLAWFAIGPAAALALVALALLEVAMAADSSVPMAGIAARLHSPARRLFLSLGIVAGVLAMRLLLPPAAVAASLGADPSAAVDEAVFRPGAFAAHLADVRPALAAFGAAFIWLVFAEYLFNTDRASRRAWLGGLEARLARVGRPRLWSLVTAGAGVAVTGTLVAVSGEGVAPVLVGGGLGVLVYLGSKRVAAWAQRDPSGWRVHVHASTVVFERGLVVFMLFEILDGAYSLSGSDSGALGTLESAAVGAAAIGIGAVFLARLASHLDEAAGLKRLRFLRAGAAYVLGVLAVLLWASLVVPIPAQVAGWFGTVVIGAALLSSLPFRARSRRRAPARSEA